MGIVFSRQHAAFARPLFFPNLFFTLPPESIQKRIKIQYPARTSRWAVLVITYGGIPAEETKERIYSEGRRG